MTPDPEVDKALLALHEGRHDEALVALLALFARADDRHFITMFAWSQLIEQYAPARAAMVRERDAQASRLLAEDTMFGEDDGGRQRGRFEIIVEMNEILEDSRTTYELFLQLLAAQPDLAKRNAWRALPAVVEAQDYVLAERYLRDPSARLPELNSLAEKVPLMPTRGEPPRLAAELSNFVGDLSLCVAVWRGLGRSAEADALQSAAIAGLANDAMRALALRELADPGVIHRETADANMHVDAVRAYTAEDFAAVCRIYLEAKPDELRFETASFNITPLEQDQGLLAAFVQSDVMVYDADGIHGFAAVFDGQLRALFVQRAARGRGVGQALLNAVLEKTPGEITLNVARSNHGAISFYEKNGFALSGETIRQYDGKEVAYVRMSRP
ncbi:ribosomal protein S18 acetylase RimI-like enzyme [Duganella sp. 1224]|uniref:GNAT family N-acetyltransferase n=1 Tax=Duganella sp. 1224 TaxID=2587052 RepID=UPI0015CDF4F8|nr:GNAT family N-acetyltransferase [Duganella sp. 1224]NYE59580.1 ribosomal protein S18 acetylase RimI-like enzyme [Duganella sp. 1224]